MLQPMSKKRTFITDFEQPIQSAFFAAWRLDTKNAGTLHGVLLELIRKPNSFARIRISSVSKLPSKSSTNLGAPQLNGFLLLPDTTRRPGFSKTELPIRKACFREVATRQSICNQCPE